MSSTTAWESEELQYSLGKWAGSGKNGQGFCPSQQGVTHADTAQGSISSATSDLDLLLTGSWEAWVPERGASLWWRGCIPTSQKEDVEVFFSWACVTRLRGKTTDEVKCWKVNRAQWLLGRASSSQDKMSFLQRPQPYFLLPQHLALYWLTTASPQAIWFSLFCLDWPRLCPSPILSPPKCPSFSKTTTVLCSSLKLYVFLAFI